MQIITAIIRPALLDRVIGALEEIDGFPGLTVTAARGFGRRMTRREQHAHHLNELTEKARLEIVAPDDQVPGIVATLMHAAQTGRNGDGKIFVWPVGQAVRIQTGETGEAAV